MSLRIRDYKKEYAYLKVWRAKNRDKHRLIDKRHYGKHKKEIADRRKRCRSANPDRLNDYEKRPERKAKKAVRLKAQRAVPLGSSCELCPEDDIRTVGLERHHPDYSEPLIVVTVCSECNKWIEVSA